MTRITDEQYEALFKFRHALRTFLRWSEDRATDAGLTTRQHQLLLAVRANTAERGPSVGEVAGYLLIKPHSAVELVNRVEAMGLVTRGDDPDDQRVVRVSLTPEGQTKLDALTNVHLAEFSRAANALRTSSEFLTHLATTFDPDSLEDS